jgi:hypothetical protein
VASIPQEYFKLYTGKNAAKLLNSLPEAEDIHWENEHREFKSGQAFNKIALAKEPKEREAAVTALRATWSEVIGAFGNTGGGVLIWGIHAKAEGGIDAPTSVDCVQKPNELITRLRKLALDATDPPLEGIQYKVIHAKGNSGPGFVICYLPEGKQKPYRSLRTEKEFYIRNDDNCISPNLSLLKQLFTPNRYPHLKLIIEPSEVQRMTFKGGFKIRIFNDSDYTLRNAIAHLRVMDSSSHLYIMAGDQCLEKSRDGLLKLEANGFLHPDYNLSKRISYNTTGTSFSFKSTVHANDCRQMIARVTVPLPITEKYEVAFKPESAEEE